MPEVSVSGSRRATATGSLFLSTGGLLSLPGGLWGAVPTPGEQDGTGRDYHYERQAHEKWPQPPPSAAFAVFSMGQGPPPASVVFEIFTDGSSLPDHAPRGARPVRGPLLSAHGARQARGSGKEGRGANHRPPRTFFHAGLYVLSTYSLGLDRRSCSQRPCPPGWRRRCLRRLPRALPCRRSRSGLFRGRRRSCRCPDRP